MVTESDYSQSLTKALRKHCKAIVFKIHGHGWQQPGIPDFFLGHEKYSGWIETKGKDTKLSPAQKVIIAELRRVNVNVYIVRFISPNCLWIEHLDGEHASQIKFTSWKEAAEKTLDELQRLVEIENERQYEIILGKLRGKEEDK